MIYPVKAKHIARDNLPETFVTNITRNMASDDISARKDLLSISIFMPDAAEIRP
jgi:hypothetical protein